MRYDGTALADRLLLGRAELRAASNRGDLRIRVHPSNTRDAVIFALATAWPPAVGSAWHGEVRFATMPILGDESLPDDGTVIIETEDEVTFVYTAGLRRQLPGHIRYATRMQLVVPIRPEEL